MHTSRVCTRMADMATSKGEYRILYFPVLEPAARTSEVCLASFLCNISLKIAGTKGLTVKKRIPLIACLASLLVSEVLAVSTLSQKLSANTKLYTEGCLYQLGLSW